MTTRAKDPTIIAEAQKVVVFAKKTLRILAVFVPVVIVIIWIVSAVNGALGPGGNTADLSAPSLKSFGAFAWKYWLWLLIGLAGLYGYGFATTKLPAPATAPGAVPSRWRVMGLAAMPVSIVLAVLLGAAALWNAWGGPSSPSVTCRSAAPEVRSCALSAEWSNWIQPTEGVANGLHFCGIPAGLPNETRVTQGGTTLMRFRAPSGTVEFRYYLAPTAACEIPGKL